ncbi:unnamed protein product [Owenia fusiformis]|uniref:Nuclear receptor-binding protein homolog n=1 Tax=Owenia fusiformis TaxID=6347 RepID=A0A8J1XR45_OWEFU|nr:unnamed protein product [Owenia fusiformis]
MASKKASSNGSDTAEPEKKDTSGHDSGEESDESEILEESPCGRWQKRCEVVQQRDVRGIDQAYLAMDTDEGVEVVWNEAIISDKKSSKSQLDKIRQVFDNLIQLDHANLVKFHKYWIDSKTKQDDPKAKSSKPRVIFITEYMSSGSLKQFLKKTKKNNKTLKAWKRWCTQILSALSYLHSCDPPIIHGNLTCDTIFIQHNGLIKIGSVAPDAIYSHVKTNREQTRNMHYIAPEYADNNPVTTAVDIYSFGICALEMAALKLQGNGESSHHVPQETIDQAILSLGDPLLQDFIKRCLQKDAKSRPKARELLFHAMLFEVHSLKVMAAHSFVKNANILPENMTDEDRQTRTNLEQVIGEMVRKEGTVQWKFSQVPTLELEKFLEDVRNGIYPLTAFTFPKTPDVPRQRAVSPEIAESEKSETPEPVDLETRTVVNMNASVVVNPEVPNVRQLTILLRMDDKMNRQLSCDFSTEDTASTLADELVHYGFINEVDRDKVTTLIEDHIKAPTIPAQPPVAVETAKEIHVK